ncbi:hypothetical protein A4X13_0g8567 [Tilletia indica]|uniref:Uncharacterized protein n=1 Tax=Tilletia indica TaxID=43049 RepID=A0A177TWY1_9BASI|nr:hypothetical protein A4X13_0g8567 [Tilletia indica]
MKTGHLSLQERLQCETTCMLLFSGRLCGLNVSMGTHLIPLFKNADLYGICKDMTKPVTLVGDDAPTSKQRSYISDDFVANCAAIVDSPKPEWKSMIPVWTAISTASPTTFHLHRISGTSWTETMRRIDSWIGDGGSMLVLSDLCRFGLWDFLTLSDQERKDLKLAQSIEDVLIRKFDPDKDIFQDSFTMGRQPPELSYGRMLCVDSMNPATHTRSTTYVMFTHPPGVFRRGLRQQALAHYATALSVSVAFLAFGANFGLAQGHKPDLARNCSGSVARRAKS